MTSKEIRIIEDCLKRTVRDNSLVDTFNMVNKLILYLYDCCVKDRLFIPSYVQIEVSTETRSINNVNLVHRYNPNMYSDIEFIYVNVKLILRESLLIELLK